VQHRPACSSIQWRTVDAVLSLAVDYKENVPVQKVRLQSQTEYRYIPFQAQVCAFVHMATNRCQMYVYGMEAGNKCSSHLIELILEEIKNTCIGEKGI